MYRRQASLYLSGVPQIELPRLRHNPSQARLIPAHVTLCREDEVIDWNAINAKLESLVPFEITLHFGSPIRENHFVYLPVCEGADAFHEFRRSLLGNEPRRHNPHVTIVHPRNGTCNDSIFAEISQGISPFQFIFREVVLIEQAGDGPWNLIARIGTTNG